MVTITTAATACMTISTAVWGEDDPGTVGI
jgi:hypothetical protein